MFRRASSRLAERTIAVTALLAGLGAAILYSYRYLSSGTILLILSLAINAAQYYRLLIVRKGRDAARCANAAKGRFLANISREIRTPMDGVIGMTDLLLNTNLRPEQKDFAGTVKSSAMELLRMLDEMLDYARIIDGQVHLSDHDFYFRELLETVVERYAREAAAKSLDLTCHIADDVPDLACGDAVRLQQVLTQLVGNAVKFTNRGYVCVRARSLPSQEGKVVLHISVADSGVGVKAEDRARILESFEAALPETLEAPRGIGLAIARQIVTRCGGVIDFESTPGEGSCFWVVIPFGRSPIRVPACITAAQLQGRSVRIVTESEHLARMLAQFGTSLCMTVSECRIAAAGTAPARDLSILDETAAWSLLRRRINPGEILLIDHTSLDARSAVMERPLRRRVLEDALRRLVASPVPNPHSESATDALQRLAEAALHDTDVVKQP